jgi:hypothetical protein
MGQISKLYELCDIKTDVFDIDPKKSWITSIYINYLSVDLKSNKDFGHFLIISHSNSLKLVPHHV